MKCLTCGTFFPDESTFCLVCGARVSETAETSAGVPTTRVFDIPSPSSSASTLQRSTYSAPGSFSVPTASHVSQSSPDTAAGVPTSSLAIVSIVSAILAWIAIPGIGSIVAIITGHMARREIRHSAGALSGDQMAKAGMTLGCIQLGMAALVIGVGIVFFFMVSSTAAYSFNINHFASIITVRG